MTFAGTRMYSVCCSYSELNVQSLADDLRKLSKFMRVVYSDMA